ncbi:Region of a membrane-bound protein predicted to be embedded in the membrane [Methanobacterium congolense]|uniref:Region of a membrane-bound protein predicted to be embedded in the membrane n=1 Tax=Methanobacterium congolense TaxID=118062 RepID=A0A1D3L2Q2_9EURY|nr:Region of a membrane-bound protein predicted to be embedded in the membrane [Methanobacterium congolense]
MVNELHLVYEQLFLCIILLIGFLGSGNPLLLFVCLGGLMGILILTVRIKNYNPKLNDLVLVLILFQGLTLVYTYLFRLKYLQSLSSTFLFYSFVVLWIFTIISYIYYYSKKNYKSKDHRN